VAPRQEEEEPAFPAPAPAAAARFETPVLAAPSSPRAGTPSGSGRFDPSVEAVLEAQEKFYGLWKDIDRVSKARDRLDEGKYFQAVVGATQDYLELKEPARTEFTYATQAGIAEVARARKERDEAKALLPPRDKGNPAAYAAYKAQDDAIDARYGAQVKAAAGHVTRMLDTGRPRHAEFAASADKWLRYLLPRSNQP
jgi:hypothetical protein